MMRQKDRKAVLDFEVGVAEIPEIVRGRRLSAIRTTCFAVAADLGPTSDCTTRSSLACPA
jgi:hypothetical protein